jgi:hypothetical protein
MLTRSLLAAAILTAGLPVTASAATRRFDGETAQSRAVKVVVGDAGRVQRMEVAWRAGDCRRRGTFATILRPPPRHASADAFTAARSYRVRGKGGIRIRIRVSARGSRTFDPAERWSGTLRARSTVRRGGRVIDRCRLRTTWSAGLPPAPQPSPPPPTSDPPAPEPGGWSAQFTSDPGDFVGQGRSYSFGPPDHDIGVTATREHVSFRIGNWVGEFEAPAGQVLEAGGTYDGARRHPFNDDAPGLSVTGEFRGCDEISGTFTVHRVEFSGPGELHAFEVTFEQHCEHKVPALRGTWTYVAD